MQGHEFNPLSGNQDPTCCRVQPKIGNKKNPLPEFTESCFRLLFFTTKGHRLESAKRRSTEGRVWESSSQTASCSPLPKGSETEQLNCSGVNAWQQAQETDNQRSSPKPCDQSFHWNLWPYSPAPSEGELIPQDPKTPLEITLLNCLVRPAPALNHGCRLFSVTPGPQANRDSPSGRTSQGLEIIPPGIQGQRPDLSLGSIKFLTT